MEKKQYDLCVEVLKRLDRVGILGSLILIGSWCVPFYKEYFKSTTYGLSLRTRDVDFLVPLATKFKKIIDLPKLFEDLGFILSFKGEEGYIRLEHPDLAIEFLVPETGRGSTEPFKLPDLGINAQQLRYLQILSEDTINVEKEGITVRLPHPALFALHKLIVANLRKNRDKKEKDIKESLQTLKIILEKEGPAVIHRHFHMIMPSWQNKIVKLLRQIDEVEILTILKGK
ncbi:MAG: GSU2403 family nucleotidyltransferase fold protein [Candidatus Omnitrophica bacterium]|nr:GSU2403 family nucleotidyltransferase fold protein [Candidatus Omnitrophota bacterium]